MRTRLSLVAAARAARRPVRCAVAVHLALAASLASFSARAELDTFGLGAGDGPLTVSRADTVINRYAPLSARVGAGATTIPVSSTTGFNPNDLVLVWQAGSLSPAPAPSNPTEPVTLAVGVGRWELARVRDVRTGMITLVRPLLNDYARGTSQVVRVPEFTDVTINAGASLVGRAWDGSSGGVVAFFARGTLTNNGTISANAMGFRGGVVVNDPRTSLGCTSLTEVGPRGGRRGESVALDAFGATQTGRGAVANGGGGGVCHNAGGGGGGHGGFGGLGGFSYLEARVGFEDDGGRNVGGFGGAALQYSLLERLSFGGGGGAGHANMNQGRDAGAGGGVVFLRAGTVRGNGVISADGQTPATGGPEGQGGGGAGGAIVLRVRGEAACMRLSARGGNGGSGTWATRNAHGPGGGGGGGVVLLQSAGGACAPDVSAGVAGTQPGPSMAGPSHGATNTSPTAARFVGVIQRANPGGFRELAAPTIAMPADMSRPSTRRPEIVGRADPNTTVVVVIDGTEIGRATTDASGNFRVTPMRDLSPGAHTIYAQSTTGDGSWSVPSADTHITIGDSMDTDMDGLPDTVETMIGTDPRNPDSDMDGLPDGVEVPDPTMPRDTNGNGTIDARDPDDDGDGVPTIEERPSGRDRDTNGNGTADHLDPDDDGDGIPTRDERMFDGSADGDFDRDGIPSYLDTDADGDTVPDRTEGVVDTDTDGGRDFLDLDSDNDCIPDATEPGPERIVAAAMPDTNCAGSPLGPVCDTAHGVCVPCLGAGCMADAGDDGGSVEPDAAVEMPDAAMPMSDAAMPTPDARPDARADAMSDAGADDASTEDDAATPSGRLSGGGLIACAVRVPGARRSSLALVALCAASLALGSRRGRNGKGR